MHGRDRLWQAILRQMKAWKQLSGNGKDLASATALPIWEKDLLKGLPNRGWSAAAVP
jgi:hypothetical protein